MRFPDSFLDEIRARLPVSEVVRRRVQLKKQGREWRGLSPFNKEKTPSFYVNDHKGFYHDFSSGKSGDQFRFLMETEGLSFPEAVERLAQMAGLPLPIQSKEAERFEQKRKTLYEVMEMAARFYQSQFESDTGKNARDYAKRRGLEQKTIAEFIIGYAPAGRFVLKEYLGKHGVSVDEMIEAGLLIAGDDIPVPYDRFRDRLMIPIHDARGRIVAFGGRALSPDAQAKYLNSPETVLFHKGATVFNFHRARQAAHDEGSVVVVEGYMDAISVYQSGLKSVVASMGTAFTEEQITSLWRLSTEPIICFDADNAGLKAAYRAIDRILPELKVGRTFRFAFMTGGKDPDDLIRENGIDSFRLVLSGSLPVWDVLWQREVVGANIDTPDARARLEGSLYEIIRTIRDPLIQAQYKGTCRVELSALFWERVREIGQKKIKKAKGEFPRLLSKIDIHQHEIQKVLLGLLVHYPQFLEEKESAVGRISFESNLEGFHSALYDLLVISKDVSVEFIYERLSPEFYNVLEQVHGHASDRSVRGHKLMSRLPIIRFDPPEDFISRCIDYFILRLMVGQMRAELEEFITGDDPLASDASGERLTRLVQEILEQEERATAIDLALAEEAITIRRIWGGGEWVQTAA